LFQGSSYIACEYMPSGRNIVGSMNLRFLATDNWGRRSKSNFRCYS
jgi:hypothetical protein